MVCGEFLNCFRTAIFQNVCVPSDTPLSTYYSCNFSQLLRVAVFTQLTNKAEQKRTSKVNFELLSKHEVHNFDSIIFNPFLAGPHFLKHSIPPTPLLNIKPPPSKNFRVIPSLSINHYFFKATLSSSNST